MLIDGKRVAVIGSRSYGLTYDSESETYNQDLSEVYEFVGSLPGDVTIVSGGARGVDTAAVNAAKKYGLQYKVWEADWRTHGKAAGFVRNYQIVDDADLVVAFWDNVSRGTRHSIEYAERTGKGVLIFHFGG